MFWFLNTQKDHRITLTTTEVFRLSIVYVKYLLMFLVTDFRFGLKIKSYWMKHKQGLEKNIVLLIIPLYYNHSLKSIFLKNGVDFIAYLISRRAEARYFYF